MRTQKTCSPLLCQSLTNNSGCTSIDIIIDIIDYVHGIGNMRAIRVAVKSGKIDKISQKNGQK